MFDLYPPIWTWASTLETLQTKLQVTRAFPPELGFPTKLVDRHLATFFGKLLLELLATYTSCIHVTCMASWLAIPTSSSFSRSTKAVLRPARGSKRVVSGVSFVKTKITVRPGFCIILFHGFLWFVILFFAWFTCSASNLETSQDASESQGSKLEFGGGPRPFRGA